eukprot:758883-Hanusia_phi.AAC.1
MIEQAKKRIPLVEDLLSHVLHVHVAQQRRPDVRVAQRRHSTHPHADEGDVAALEVVLVHEEQPPSLIEREEAGRGRRVLSLSVVERLGERGRNHFQQLQRREGEGVAGESSLAYVDEVACSENAE